MSTRSLLGSLVVLLSLTTCAVGCSAEASEDDSEGTRDAISGGKLASSYSGTVAGQKVMSHLEVKGTTVTGDYFYVKDTEKDTARLSLKGTYASGKLTLEESDGKRKTGSFAGTVDASGKIKGTWKAASDGKTAPFAFDAITTRTIFTHHLRDSAPGVEASGSLDKCEVDIQYLEVFGMSDAAVQASVNKVLADGKGGITKNADGKCEEVETASGTSKITLDHNDILVAEHESSWFAGGAYPDNNIRFSNLSLKTGKDLKLSDVLKPGAAPKFKGLIKVIIDNRLPEEEDAEVLYRALDSAFENPDKVDFQTYKYGLVVTLINHLPHAKKGLEQGAFIIDWDAARGLINPQSEVAALVR